VTKAKAKKHRDVKPSNTPAAPSALGTDHLEAIRSWADDNLDAANELLTVDVDECWRALFEKKSKIFSAAEKATQKQAMLVELRRYHGELGAKLDGGDREVEATPDAPGLPLPDGVTGVRIIRGHRVHPAANVFPMLIDSELQELALDIKAHGQRDAIEQLDGMILDGRNRLEACGIAGVDPWIVEWEPNGKSPLAYVVSKNIHRRHLDKDARAIAAVRLLPLFEAEAKGRMRAGGRIGADTTNRGLESRGSAPGALPQSQPGGKASAAAASAANVGTRTVERAKRVDKEAPALAEKVLAGDMSLKQAERQIRTSEQRSKIRTYLPPEGRYSVIAADFPWKFDVRGEDDSHRGNMPYPPMSVTDIEAFEMAALADDDCVLFLWCTNTHLVDGTVARVLRAWGFEPKTIHTWIKTTEEAETPGELAETRAQYGTGNWGRGGTEHYVVAVKGSPVVNFASLVNWFAAPRREHSRKPELFYQRIEQACAAPAKLELFARERRSGWVCSGAEVDKFDEAQEKLAIAGAKAHAAAAPADEVEKESSASETRDPSAWNCNCGGALGKVPRHMLGDRGCVAKASPVVEDDEPPHVRNSKLALSSSYEVQRGIIAHRDWGGSFAGLVDTLERGDRVELRPLRAGAFSKGSAFTGPATVIGWGKDTRKQKLAVDIEGQMRTVDREAVEAIREVVSTRPIEALSRDVKNDVLAWAREALDVAKKKLDQDDVQRCWRDLIANDIELQANQRPAVDVQLEAARKQVLAELEERREARAS
jgi:N6-adenosine-specific RNA methylase IME4